MHAPQFLMNGLTAAAKCTSENPLASGYLESSDHLKQPQSNLKVLILGRWNRREHF
jgi:hypothetical protein